MDIKSIAIKSVIGLATAGGASFAIHQGIKALNNETKQQEKEKSSKSTISDRLKTNGYIPLKDTTTNTQKWEAILQSYKSVVAKKANLKFGEFDGNEPTGGKPKAIDTLKQECAKALASEENTLLNKAKKWCVDPIAVSDLLGKQGVTALKTNKSNHQEQRDKWEKKINAYKLAKKENSALELINISDSESAITEQNLSDIKEKCINFAKIVSHNTDFEDTLEKFKTYCTDN